MTEITQIRNSGSLPFSFGRDGKSIDGWTATIYVKEFPSDAASITRVLVVDPNNPLVWTGFLTSAEMLTLAPGDWHIYAKLANTTTGEAREVTEQTVRFHIGRTIAN